MTEHPNEQDMANKAEREAAYRNEQIDALLNRFAVPFGVPDPMPMELLGQYIFRVARAFQGYVNGETVDG